MTIYISVKNNKKSRDYIFVDELSKDCYENSLFRINFKFDTLKKENIELIDEYLQTSLNNMLEVLNGSDESSLHSGSHEDRIKSLEEEIATLTNNVNSQTPIYGILKITPISENIDFNKEGTMLKFTNADGGVYTTSILKNETQLEIVLPIGEYTVNVVNSLNDITDAVFIELWDTATSEDMNHTMKYNVIEGTVELDAKLEYENAKAGI